MITLFEGRERPVQDGLHSILRRSRRLKTGIDSVPEKLVEDLQLYLPDCLNAAFAALGLPRQTIAAGMAGPFVKWLLVLLTAPGL